MFEDRIDLDDVFVGKISAFEYNPYIYIEPVYYNSFFGDTPIVRIGDLLTTGNATAATGLTLHFNMIARLSCMLNGRNECYET